MPHGKSKPQRLASGSSCPLILERAPHRSDGRNNRRRGKQRSGCGKLAAAALAVAIVAIAAAYFTQHGR
jgi:hypothetical protein